MQGASGGKDRRGQPRGEQDSHIMIIIFFINTLIPSDCTLEIHFSEVRLNPGASGSPLYGIPPLGSGLLDQDWSLTLQGGRSTGPGLGIPCLLTHSYPYLNLKFGPYARVFVL